MKTISLLLRRFLLVIALIWIVSPLYLVITTSFKERNIAFSMPPKWIFVPTLDNYREVLKGGQFMADYLNTMIIVGGSVGIAMIAGVPAAYALSRYKFKGRTFLGGLILGSRLFPQITIIVPLFIIWAEVKFLNTYYGMILAYTQLNLGLVVWMLKGFFSDIPFDLEEAAAVDGASRWQAILRILLPLAAPGIAATTILAIIFGWNEFLFAIALSGRDTRPITVTVYSFMRAEEYHFGALHAAATLVILPVFVFSFLVQRHIVRGLVSGALK